jgi:MFS family permease
MVTLGVYMLGTALTGASFVPAWYFAFRFITGMGIGGEYAAINSAIDELIPARVRGRADLIINGSYWLGAMAAAALSLLLLDTAVLPKDVGWRICFALGLALATAILVVRRNVPESPRWLFIHGREREAERIVDRIEREVRDTTGVDDLAEPDGAITVRQRRSIGFLTIARAVFVRYPRRSALGLSLFVGQAFLYNAIFFSYVLILKDFFHVKSNPELYLIPFAAGNFLGPLLLGRLFDTIGRRVMISSTYVLAGACLAITGWMFYVGNLDPATQTIAFVVIFFLASAGASSAYLTVSEVFPMETRALAIAFFYSVGTAAGGISGPLLFAELVASKQPGQLFFGYMLGAGLMIAAGSVAAFLAVDAEQRSLEGTVRAAPSSRASAGPRVPPAESAGRRVPPARLPVGASPRHEACRAPDSRLLAGRASASGDGSSGSR